MKFRYTSIEDLEERARALEAAIMDGVTEVTYAGHTTRFASPEKLKQSLADTYASIDAAKGVDNSENLKYLQLIQQSRGYDQ